FAAMAILPILALVPVALFVPLAPVVLRRVAPFAVSTGRMPVASLGAVALLVAVAAVVVASALRGAGGRCGALDPRAALPALVLGAGARRLPVVAAARLFAAPGVAVLVVARTRVRTGGAPAPVVVGGGGGWGSREQQA